MPAMYTVLDTNFVVSALLFRGRAAGIYRAYREGKIIPCMSPSIFSEYRKVLAYSKFALTYGQLSYLIKEEILPFFVQCTSPAETVNWIPDDPEDNKFIDLTKVLPGCELVSGDRHITSGHASLQDQYVGRVSYIAQTLTHFLPDTHYKASKEE